MRQDASGDLFLHTGSSVPAGYSFRRRVPTSAPASSGHDGCSAVTYWNRATVTRALIAPRGRWVAACSLYAGQSSRTREILTSSTLIGTGWNGYTSFSVSATGTATGTRT